MPGDHSPPAARQGSTAVEKHQWTILYRVAGIADRRFNVPVRPLAPVFCALLLAAPASGAATLPALRPVSLQPLTVQGLRFRANERVTLLLASDGVASKRVVRAGARGRFTVRYTLRVDRCTSYTLQAIGARGSRALLQRDVIDCIEP